MILISCTYLNHQRLEHSRAAALMKHIDAGISLSLVSGQVRHENWETSSSYPFGVSLTKIVNRGLASGAFERSARCISDATFASSLHWFASSPAPNDSHMARPRRGFPPR